MAWLGYYLLKALACAKNRVPRRGSPDRYQLFSTERGLTHTLALRAAEFWSHVSAFDAVYGVGDGKHVRTDYAQALRAWECSNRGSSDHLDPSRDREPMWRQHWARTGQPYYASWHQRECTC